VSNPFASVWYLGQYSTNSHVDAVSVDDELLPWSQVAQDSCRTQCLSEWRAVSASGDHSNVHFPSLNLISSLGISVIPAINLLSYVHSPRKLLSWCLLFGLGQLFTASSFLGSLVTPDSETV